MLDLANEANMKCKRIILVALSLQSESLDLLSWALTLASKPGDSIMLIHVLGPDPALDWKGLGCLEKQEKDARAAIYRLLHLCNELCHLRQIEVDVLKVGKAESVQSILMKRASALHATMLVMGVSHRSAFCWHSRRKCMYEAPAECSVVFIRNRKVLLFKNNVLERSIDDQSIDAKQIQCNNAENCTTGTDVLKRLPIPECLSPGSSECSPSRSCSLLSHSSSTKSLLALNERSEGHDVDDVYHNSCLNLFKNIAKRQTTFPGAERRNVLSCLSSNSLEHISKSSGSNLRKSLMDLELSSLCLDGRYSWRCFKYYELLKATTGFSPDNLVGNGGHAEVYKGCLPDGQTVAIKKITSGKTDEERECGFLSELGIIGHVCHSNATALMGFCTEQGLYLIFPLSPCGSLAALLHGPTPQALDWPARHKIAVGTARGLHYLHKSCQRRIIHRDIKSSNILLGVDYEPQISDFGLAKWLPQQLSHHIVTPIEGTFGYLAPEYFMHGHVDEKTDVFAFGVVLLELITGRQPIDSSHQHIVAWAKKNFTVDDLESLVDHRLKGVYDRNQLQKMILTAALCTRNCATWRPCMDQVLKLLTKEVTDPELLESWLWHSRDLNTIDDVYSSKEYQNDMNRHRALALECVK